jgi:tRNA (guanine37-N1)-methyltransferase
MSWCVNILTLFPDMFPGSLGQSLSGRALEKGLWSYNTVNIREFAADKHKTVDDTPFGGGAGMVMRPDTIEKALLSIPKPGKIIYMSPRGKPLTQERVKEFSNTPAITILCGRYEGVDQRVLDAHDIEEVSIGDYVLSGGEPAALILMDACIRLLPNVMGNSATPDEESFSNGLLEYPHYTKPDPWVDSFGTTHSVPDIVKSGHHKKINDWRLEQSIELTKQRRPDLIKKT